MHVDRVLFTAGSASAFAAAAAGGDDDNFFVYHLNIWKLNIDWLIENRFCEWNFARRIDLGQSKPWTWIIARHWYCPTTKIKIKICGQ